MIYYSQNISRYKKLNGVKWECQQWISVNMKFMDLKM